MLDLLRGRLDVTEFVCVKIDVGESMNVKLPTCADQLEKFSPKWTLHSNPVATLFVIFVILLELLFITRDTLSW